METVNQDNDNTRRPRYNVDGPAAADLQLSRGKAEVWICNGLASLDVMTR